MPQTKGWDMQTSNQYCIWNTLWENSRGCPPLSLLLLEEHSFECFSQTLQLWAVPEQIFSKQPVKYTNHQEGICNLPLPQYPYTTTLQPEKNRWVCFLPRPSDKSITCPQQVYWLTNFRKRRVSMILVGKDCAGLTGISIYTLPKAAPSRHSFHEEAKALCYWHQVG